MRPCPVADPFPAFVRSVYVDRSVIGSVRSRILTPGTTP